MNKIAAGIRRLFQANPPGIAVFLSVSLSWTRMRSWLFGFLLGARDLRIGPGCRIIGAKNISFGRGVFIQRNLWLEALSSYRAQRFDPKIAIGDYVSFSDGVHISAISSITIGRHTLFGSKIYVSDHNHGIYRGGSQSCPDEPPVHRLLGGGGTVVIGENVWIGDNSVIVGPANIGNGAIIGANSIVRGTVPSNAIVVGTPAKPIKVFNFQTRSWERV